MSNNLTIVLLTGQPGAGKTTLIKKVVEELQFKKNLKCQGFYTEEVRHQGGGLRIGFDVITLDGKRGILARESPTDQEKRPKIGKYTVYTKNFEDLVLPLLSNRISNEIHVIDEIGKMELLGKKFEEAVKNIIGKSLLIATIPSQSRQSIPIVERLRSSESAVVFEISKRNRDHMKDEIIQTVMQMIHK